MTRLSGKCRGKRQNGRNQTKRVNCDNYLKIVSKTNKKYLFCTKNKYNECVNKQKETAVIMKCLLEED